MMEQQIASALAYAHRNRERFLEELSEFLRIPSVSTEAEHRKDVQRAAEWLARQLESLGTSQVRIFPTPGAPLVVGASIPPKGAAHTVLVYGHYDVQPTDPIEEWKSDPFSPDRRGEELYARGASDMKGQILAVLKAVESISAAGGLPLQVKYLFEGEEEVGSPNLPEFIRSHRELLAADLCLNPDAGMLSPELPTITYALRGLAYFELRVHGPSRDLHSGGFGGVVHNPAQALCELIAAMHDDQGRVALPGFYDSVRPLEEEERAELARLPVDEASLLGLTGAPQLWGEAGYTPAERIGARPTLEVNGLYSGFIAEGQKTVLPARATAKISARLVPEQKAEEVARQMERFLEEHAPPTVRWELRLLSGSPAVISRRDSPGSRALGEAMEAVWGRRPLFRREGGSIPVGTYLQETLGMESLLTGFALPDDRSHSPNEKLHLPTWSKGVDALVRFFFYLAGSSAPGPRMKRTNT
jgi:acetylornithine deacetylase/succinyl-diaminopimelate desuccinylase-like protein